MAKQSQPHQQHQQVTLINSSGEPLDPNEPVIVGGPTGVRTIKAKNWKGVKRDDNMSHKTDQS